MLAIDTNVVIRFLARDDPAQTLVAIRCIEAGVYVSDGVVMEAEWVLRRIYRWDRQRVSHGFQRLLALDSVEVRNIDELSWALERHVAGADFADMLHLLAAKPAGAFASFDARLAAEAGADAPVRVVRL